jgi:hypothetical protein
MALAMARAAGLSTRAKENVFARGEIPMSIYDNVLSQI